MPHRMLNNLVEYLTAHNKIRDNYRIESSSIAKQTGIICGVIAISKNSSKILLVQGRRTGKWSLPKGHIEKNETYEACARREFEEETGIKINDFTLKNDIAKLRVGIYYFYEAEEEYVLNPRDNFEVISSGWFSLKDMETGYMELNVDANYIYRCLKQCKPTEYE